jgi:hypothetical protein
MSHTTRFSTILVFLRYLPYTHHKGRGHLPQVDHEKVDTSMKEEVKKNIRIVTSY